MDYYKFIRPQHKSPRTPKVLVGRDAVLRGIAHVTTTNPPVVHYDLETTSLQYADPKQFITNVGLACDDYLVGLDLTDLTFEEVQPLWDWLAGQNLAGFNLGFDLAWPWRTPTNDGRVVQNIQDIKVDTDTSLWFRLLGTEMHFAQDYKLETAIEKILQWPQADQQKAWLKDALVKYNISKAQMYILAVNEAHDYTKYCAMDAEASYQLSQVFRDTLEYWGFEGLENYFQNILVPKVKRNIVACSHGIPIDRDILTRNIEWCNARALMLEAKALAHCDMFPYVDEFIKEKLSKNHVLRPHLKKVWAKKSDEPWKYPDKYRLEISANPDKLPAWCKEFGGKFYEPETQFTISKPNQVWPRFNVNATSDMKWLIYEKWLDNKYKVWYKDSENPKYGGLVTIQKDGKSYEFKLTKAGGLPTGGDIMNIFGEIGQILTEYKQLDKLTGDFLEKFELASRRTNHIHPQGKVLGAGTGRMSGGN